MLASGIEQDGCCQGGGFYCNGPKKGSSGICLDDRLLAIDTKASLGQGELRGKVHPEPPVFCFGSLECPSSASAAAILNDHEPDSN